MTDDNKTLETSSVKKRRYTPEQRKRKQARDRAGILAWRARNPDKVKIYNQKSYQRNRHKGLNAVWRLKHPEKMREYNRNWTIRNIERIREKCRKYQKDHPENRRHQEHRRRAIKRGGNIEACNSKIKSLMLERFCRWCCSKLSQIHIDHIIPLSRGGQHIPDNLCASCPKCNWSKNDSLVEEWLPLQKFN